MSRPVLIVFWLLRAFVGVMFLFAALPKLTGDATAIETFTTLGVESWGRYVTGVVELGVAILILVPRTVLIGAGLGVLTMLGALGAHVTTLGFAGDAGGMAGLAVVLLLASLAIIGIASRFDGARPSSTRQAAL